MANQYREADFFSLVIRTVQQWMGCVGNGQPVEDVLRQHDGWLRSCRSAPLSVI